jgi:hypothetical protein
MPELDARIAAHDPFLVCSVQVDGDAAKRLVARNHCHIDVRMRDGDGLLATEPLEEDDGRGGEQR